VVADDFLAKIDGRAKRSKRPAFYRLAQDLLLCKLHHGLAHPVYLFFCLFLDSDADFAAEYCRLSQSMIPNFELANDNAQFLITNRKSLFNDTPISDHHSPRKMSSRANDGALFGDTIFSTKPLQ
jgi:hypothetical protein